MKEPVIRSWSDARFVRSGTAVFFLLTILLSVQWSPAFRGITTDSGAFMYFGSRMLHGDLPYVNFWDHKPPGVYLFNALGLLLGIGPWGVWLVENVLFALSVACLFFAAVKPFGRLSAVLGMMFYVLAARSNLFYAGGNLSESYVLPFLNVVLVFVLRPPKRWVGWVLTGVCAGIVFLTKQPYVAVPAALAFLLICRSIKNRSSEDLKAFLLIVAGGVLVLGTTGIAMWRLGIWGEFLDQNVTYNLLYVRRQGPGLGSLRGLWTLLKGWESLGVLSALLFVILVSLIRVFDRRCIGERLPCRWIAAVVGLSSVIQSAALFALNGARSHYFSPVLPVIALGFALWCNTVVLIARKHVKPKSLRSLRRPFKALVVGICFLCGPFVTTQILTLVGAVVLVKQQDEQDVLTYLQDLPRDSPLLVWGDDLRLNFLSGHVSPSRYAYVFPLSASEYDHARRFREFMKNLADHPDTIILDTKLYGLNVLTPSPAEAVIANAPLRQVPEDSLKVLREYIAEHYRVDREFRNSWVAYVPRAE